MDTVSPALAARSAVPAGPLLARALTPGESAHLDRLRDWLQGDGTDARDVAALDARWARLLQTHPAGAPAPAGVAAAIGIAVGDLLVASVTDAMWMMCPGPEGATPGVLLPDRPHMPVLPVLDAHARWRVRSPAWTVDYVERAAAHLGAGRVPAPTPHAPAVTPAVAAPDDAAVEPLDAARAPDRDPDAWSPSFVDDGTLEPPATDPDAWSPSFVDDGTLEPPATDPEVWAPRFAHEAVPPAPAAAPAPAALWAPAFVDPSPQTSLAHRSRPPEAEAAVGVPQHEPSPAAQAATATPGRGVPATTHHPLTPEDLPHRPSERVQDLALRALELALDRAVRDQAGCAPFVLVREGADIEVLDFPPSASGLAQAREAARAGLYTAAAVAWTSPADGTRPHPRVVVDASAPGRPGIRVAHSFAHDDDGGREIGGPQVVGQSAPVL